MELTDRELAEQYRQLYPKGTRLRLIHMTDLTPVPAGTEGTVTHIDDIAQVHMNWDNGSTLALVPLVDEFEVIK